VGTAGTKVHASPTPDANGTEDVIPMERVRVTAMHHLPFAADYASAKRN
jgi:hypothetical protein